MNIKVANSKKLKLSIGIKLVLLFIVVLPVALLVHILFLNSIHNFHSGNQSDYIIDGYYYIYLGQQAIDIAKETGNSLYQVAQSISPNANSTGIVLLSSIVSYVSPSIYFIPVIFVSIYILIFYFLLKSWSFSPFVLLFPFSGLLPYLFIPTKESFFLIGFLLILLALFKREYFIFGMIGLIIMYLARPQGLYLWLIAQFLWMIYRRNKLLLGFIILLLIVGYAFYARDFVFSLASIFQAQAAQSGTEFCNVGFLHVCVNSIEHSEWIYLSRILTIIGLPIKWLLDMGNIVFENNLTAPTIIIRIALFLHIIWGCFIFLSSTKPDIHSKNIRSLAIAFFVIYCGTYGAILYFQSTRQILLASTILLIGWSAVKHGPYKLRISHNFLRDRLLSSI